MSESVREKTCPICLEDLLENSVTKTLQCQHTFHKFCIHSWFTIKKECPVCRGGIIVMYTDDTDTEMSYDEESGRLVISTQTQRKIRRKRLQLELADLYRRRLGAFISVISAAILFILLLAFTGILTSVQNDDFTWPIIIAYIICLVLCLPTAVTLCRETNYDLICCSSAPQRIAALQEEIRVLGSPRSTALAVAPTAAAVVEV